MRIAAPASLAVVALLIALPVESQDRWTLDVRGGPALSIRDVGQDELNTGFGFEGSVGYRLLDYIAAYAGWDWHRFSADQSFAGPNTDFGESGFAYGLRFERPYSGETSSGLAYRFRVGGTYHQIEIQDEDGEVIADSGYGIGWEGGFGITFPLSDRWRLSPAGRYRSLTRDVTIGNTVTEVDLQYLALDLGVTWSF